MAHIRDTAVSLRLYDCSTVPVRPAWRGRRKITRRGASLLTVNELVNAWDEFGSMHDLLGYCVSSVALKYFPSCRLLSLITILITKLSPTKCEVRPHRRSHRRSVCGARTGIRVVTDTIIDNRRFPTCHAPVSSSPQALPSCRACGVWCSHRDQGRHRHQHRQLRSPRAAPLGHLRQPPACTSCGGDETCGEE